MSNTIPLMLTAPHIAGLLPAYAESSSNTTCTITFRNPNFAELQSTERKRLVMAMQTLMNVAVAFMLDEMNESALRAAEALFHRAVGGTPSQNCTPEAYRAARDAELIDWWAQTANQRSTIRATTKS